MKNKLFLIGMFALNADNEKEESKVHYSAVVEMLKGSVNKYSSEQIEKILDHALYLDNKYFELANEKFQDSKKNSQNSEKRYEKMYQDSTKSKNTDRIFLWGLIGVLTFYIIYKGTMDSKQSIEI